MSFFQVRYTLRLGGYSGGAGGDSMEHQNGAGFSTIDRDNDNWGGSCSAAFQGAWWLVKYF